MTSLKLEIIQERPFASTREEAFLSLLRSADCLQRAFHLKTRGWGLTSTQYNVLRILRGTQPLGLTCSMIGERLITAVPDITRLLGRLKTMKFVTQRRDSKDRRVVWTRITREGLDLLHQMDPLIEALPMELLGHMPEEEIARLIELLEKARRPHTQPACPTLAK